MGRPGLALRVLSVLPFILLGTFAVIAVVAWIALVVFGVGPESDAVWRWAAGRGAGEVLAQLALAVGIGLVPVAILVLSMWATMRGFSERPALYFWLFTEIFFAGLALALVAGKAQWQGSLESVGLAGGQWWFALAVVGYCMTVAHLRVRVDRKTTAEEAGDG